MKKKTHLHITLSTTVGISEFIPIFWAFSAKTKQKTNIEINYTYVVSTHKNTQTYFKKKEEEKSNFEGSDLT